MLCLAFFIASVNMSFAQLDCRTMVGAYLKPLYDSSRFSWAAELTVAPGFMADRTIGNGLLILALNYDLVPAAHQLYVEPTFKQWHNSAPGPGIKGQGEGPGYQGFPKPEKKHFGLREAFYKFKGENTTLTAGLQSATLTDFFLVDERSVGLSLRHNMGAFTLDAHVGSVMQDFARMYNVCGTRHLYNLIRGGRVEFIADGFGESNMVGATLIWDPDYEAPEIIEEAEDDEFMEFEEFDSGEESKSFLNKTGIVYYQEFGVYFHDYKYYAGALAEFNIPGDFVFRFEPVMQYLTGERSIGYFLELEKLASWESGAGTLFKAVYLGKAELDDGAMFYPSYANLFYGEVMRLDVLEMPIVYAMVKHNFPWQSGFNLRLQGYAQLKDNHTSELDLIGSFKFWGHFKLAEILGLIYSDPLDELNYIVKLELRAAI